MDYFEYTKNKEDIFENEATINELSSIVAEIKKYDVYDVIARISGLNLLSYNQNKSILLDGLIAAILGENECEYNSDRKMSPGKFKRTIERLNRTKLALSIDPNENTFIQNVMFMDNYTIFNGIDCTPAYNLQKLIDILFYYENEFPEEYLRETGWLTRRVLEISNAIAYNAGTKSSVIVSDEGKEVVIPDNNLVTKYAECVVYDEKVVQQLFKGNEEILEGLTISFGNDTWGTMNNRPFYTRPFLINSKDKSLIILNVSLLPMFLFYKLLEIADEFAIKEKVVERYNDYIWRDCSKLLFELGHRKIKASQFSFELEENSYYKEQLVSVYNNQLMIVVFACDDAWKYNSETMHDSYPDARHRNKFEERMEFFYNRFNELGIGAENIYCVAILSGFGRGLMLSATKNPSIYNVITLKPFELYCIFANERDRENFFARYIRARNKIHFGMPNIFSELDTISIYTGNKYSFYINDDFNPNETSLYIPPGDSIEYINMALRDKNVTLVESYIDGWKTKVESCDSIRKMYVEEEPSEKKKCNMCIRYSNCIIWITSDEIAEEYDFELNRTIMDTVSFWLAECRHIIENLDFYDSMFHFNVVLNGEKETYFYEMKEERELSELIKVQGGRRHYNVIWCPEAFRKMNSKTNIEEKKLCRILLDVIKQNAYEPYDYEEEFEEIFSNPLKKKIFTLDYIRTPYFKPLFTKSLRKVQEEDKDYLQDIIGKAILETGKWRYGSIPDTERTAIANKVVEMLYDMLQKEVEQLSPQYLVEAIYLDLESTLYQLMLAGKRCASDLACYPEYENKFMKEHNDMNRVSMALKFLMEYVAARPPKGDVRLGIGQYEYILSICSMIIDWAYKNDLFQYNIVNTPVSILKSGRIGMKQVEFMNMYQYTDRYRREQLYYSSSSDFRKDYSINGKDYSRELDEAFLSDYGYTYEEFCKVVMGMLAYGQEKDDEEIFVVKREDLIVYLLQINPMIAETVVQKALQDISLTEREDFLKLPPGYKVYDVYPWRFNRAFSFNRRPVVMRGEEIIWGNRQLYHMLLYVADLIYDGMLSTNDKKMATLIGRISDDRGKLFNQLIVDMLKDMKVFTIDSNVKKVNKKKIVDDNGNDLGDIDVLIIDKERHHIYVAEVKDFNFSRNPYEIQREYQNMFVDGKKKSFATKHSKRVAWVQEHLEDLKKQYVLDNATWGISGVFIVGQPLISTQVYGQKLEVISKAELCVERIRRIK